jgi:hypothetical protein
MTIYNVTSGVTSSGLTLGLNDIMYVSSGGASVHSLVGRGGTEFIYSSGTSIDTQVAAFGAAYVDAGGTEIADSGGTSYGVNISGGTLIVLSGGTAIADSLISSGSNAGYGTVSGGGLAINMQVVFGGDLNVMAGGTVESGTVVESVILISGAGALVGDMNVYYNSIITVESGGTLSGTYLSGYSAIGTADDDILSGGVASDTQIGVDAFEVISSGGTSIGAQVISGTEVVSAGGTTISANVYATGTEETNSGGTSIDTQVAIGGAAYIYAGGTEIADSGGTSIQVTVSCGTLIVQSGGTSLFEQVIGDGSNAAYGIVSDGGIADEIAVLNDGNLTIRAAGTAVFGTVAQSILLVSGIGASAVDMDINYGGIATVEAGGALIDSYLSGYAQFGAAGDYVGSGGVASGTQIGDDAFEVISSGGTSIDTQAITEPPLAPPQLGRAWLCPRGESR